MNPAGSLAGAIIGHLVGDYLLQNDFLAQEKKRDSFVCALHCFTYTVSVLAFSGWWQAKIGWELVAMAIFIPHFLIDRWGFVPWYMRKIGQEKFMGPPLGPWSIIVVDNVLHLVCLHAVWTGAFPGVY